MTDREGRHPDSAEKTVRDIRRATRRKFSYASCRVGLADRSVNQAEHRTQRG